MDKKEIIFKNISSSLWEEIIAYSNFHFTSRRQIYKVLTNKKNEYFIKMCDLDKNIEKEHTLKDEWSKIEEIPKNIRPKAELYGIWLNTEVLVLEYIKTEKYDYTYMKALWHALWELNIRSSLQTFKKQYFLFHVKKVYQFHVKKWLGVKANIDMIYMYLTYYCWNVLHENEDTYLIHGDLHISNILYTGEKIVFVDWESLDYRVKELDIIACIYTHKFSSDQVRLFLDICWISQSKQQYIRLKYLYIYYVFKASSHKRPFSESQYEKALTNLCKYIHNNIDFLDIIDEDTWDNSYTFIANHE